MIKIKAKTIEVDEENSYINFKMKHKHANSEEALLIMAKLWVEIEKNDGLASQTITRRLKDYIKSIKEEEN